MLYADATVPCMYRIYLLGTSLAIYYLWYDEAVVAHVPVSPGVVTKLEYIQFYHSGK